MPSVSPYLARHRGPNWGLLSGLVFSVAVWAVAIDGLGSAAHLYANKGQHSFTRLVAEKVAHKVEHRFDRLRGVRRVG